MTRRIARLITRLARDERGATAIEYGLIAALVAVVCLTALALLSDQTLAMYTNIAASVEAAFNGG